MRQTTDQQPSGSAKALQAAPLVEPLLVTVKQAASMLCVSRTTVYELMWREELIPVRIGRSVRLSIEQLQEFIQRQTVAGTR